jgi:hypothetical protein
VRCDDEGESESACCIVAEGESDSEGTLLSRHHPLIMAVLIKGMGGGSSDIPVGRKGARVAIIVELLLLYPRVR